MPDEGKTQVKLQTFRMHKWFCYAAKRKGKWEFPRRRDGHVELWPERKQMRAQAEQTFSDIHWVAGGDVGTRIKLKVKLDKLIRARGEPAFASTDF